MSPQTKTYLVIGGMLITNYFFRALPMLVLNRLKIPEPVVVWLRYVPPAVMGAILAPALLMPERVWLLSFDNHYLLAALPAFAAALITRSLVWTLLTGMAAMAVLVNL